MITVVGRVKVTCNIANFNRVLKDTFGQVSFTPVL